MIRGIEEKHEYAARQLARDTRPLTTRFAEAISQPLWLAAFAISSAVLLFIFPAVTDLIALLFVIYTLFMLTRRSRLPFRIPKSAHLKDYNDPIPGTVKPKVGEGIAFFGNDRVTKEELWFSNDDMRTHVLIFGSTGSGKTEALISLAFNSLVQGSGFIYVDGKGDNSLFAKIFSMVRSMGREDDMLLINFMTGARDVVGPQKTRLSNTMNPFTRGSSSMLSQLVVSLMSSGGSRPGGGNDDMWTNRAINFVESLMKVLVVMRDAGHILLDANSIRDYFILEKLEQIVVDKRFPIDDTRSVPLDGYPPQILEPLAAYIYNLPGYTRQKKGNQGSEVREQHGFITMQLTRAFGSLADTYGHIIRTNLPEVDFKDVVLNRRIMVVLLPALEKSPQELSNLGKIIVASLKAMMAAGLGEEVEGDYRDVVLRKPTNSETPYLCIMDEYGYYAVEGFAVVPAQARSLGFSAIFAGQDLPAFQKASKEEAASIGANCNIKICMKLEDPQETWEYFNKTAGESYVTNVSGFQMDPGSVTQSYMDTRSASVDRRQRIDLLDLKDQRPGEAHIFFKSKIIRAELFYASPKPVKRMRLNQFLKIEPPTEHKLIDFAKRLHQFQETLSDPLFELPEPEENQDILLLEEAFEAADPHLKPYERGVAALIALLEHEVAKQRSISEPYEQEEASSQMSAFTRVVVTPLVEHMIGPENKDAFSLPLLRRGSTLEELKHIEQLCGRSEQEALNQATSVVTDIEKATQFPPEGVAVDSDVNQMVKDISDLIIFLGGEVGSTTFDEETLISLDDGHGSDHAAEDDLAELPELPEDFPDFSSLSDLAGEESKKENEEDDESAEEKSKEGKKSKQDEKNEAEQEASGSQKEAKKPKELQEEQEEQEES